MDRQETAAYIRRQVARAKYERELTQAQIADRLGVNPSHVSHWINGRSPIPDDRLLELATLLDFDPLEVRPELARFRGLWKADQSVPDSLADAIQALPPQDQALVEAYIRGLLAARDKASKP